MKRFYLKTIAASVVALLLLAGTLIVNAVFPGLWPMPGGMSVPAFIAMLTTIWLLAPLFTLIAMFTMGRHGRPQAEITMLGKLFRLFSIILMILAAAYGYGRLGTFGTLFSLFGGMVLGWSLQAPVSGFAAWVLISIKRPFRPGDRIQFPNLGLTGDVKDFGVMYVTLDQVGGTVGSEEATGRDILVPNAMLFSQVVINFTVKQEAAFMLDEIVVRITYDSDMGKAEQILLDAAHAVTGDIIVATGMQPYIRSDLYDYGLYLRLRYQTKVQDRARIAYELNKRILLGIQQAPSVDLAIPYIYSYRAGLDKKEDGRPGGPGRPPV